MTFKKASLIVSVCLLVLFWLAAFILSIYLQAYAASLLFLALLLLLGLGCSIKNIEYRWRWMNRWGSKNQTR